MLRNFVIVKHMNDGGKYLFYVPKGISLNAGDSVVCNTSHNKNELGMCCCDSFVANPDVVMPMFGTCEKKMKYIAGRVEYEMFEEAINEEEWEKWKEEHSEDGTEDG